MDETKKNPTTEKGPVKQVPKRMKDTRPLIETVDCASVSNNAYAAYNDFLIRVESLKNQRKDWADPKNQHRPFKQRFLTFIQDLIMRLPIAPEVTPLTDGTVRFRFKKNKPKDRWQIMEIIISPQRYAFITVKSRVPTQKPFVKNDLARADVISDMLQRFYEHDAVTLEGHPVRYRKAISTDYQAISTLYQMTIGLNEKMSPMNISELMEFCVVADDPMYGIVSAAALGKTKDSGDISNLKYEILFMVTAEPLRKLGFASKCLRKAMTNCLLAHPDAKLMARIIMSDDEDRDNCKGALARCGFRPSKIVTGERKYKSFECDRCNADNCNCDFLDPSSVCSTVYYELRNYGGKQGYGGKKVTE